MSKINIQTKVIQEIKSHLADPIFVKKIKEIGDKAKDDHLKAGDDDYVHHKIEEEFYFIVEELAENYKISQICRPMLQHFIIFNDFNNGDMLIDNFHLNSSLMFMDDHIGEFVNIQINKYTTLDDIRKVWPRIQVKFNNKKRIKEKNNLDRDLKIATLKRDGLTCSQIVKIINKEYPEKIISYDYVSKIIKRTCKN